MDNVKENKKIQLIIGLVDQVKKRTSTRLWNLKLED